MAFTVIKEIFQITPDEIEGHFELDYSEKSLINRIEFNYDKMDRITFVIFETQVKNKIIQKIYTINEFMEILGFDAKNLEMLTFELDTDPRAQHERYKYVLQLVVKVPHIIKEE